MYRKKFLKGIRDKNNPQWHIDPVFMVIMFFTLVYTSESYILLLTNHPYKHIYKYKFYNSNFLVKTLDIEISKKYHKIIEQILTLWWQYQTIFTRIPINYTKKTLSSHHMEPHHLSLILTLSVSIQQIPIKSSP